MKGKLFKHSALQWLSFDFVGNPIGSGETPSTLQTHEFPPTEIFNFEGTFHVWP